MTPTVTKPRYTDSFLVDWVIEVWKLYKDDQYSIAGDYYYDQIIFGVFQKKPINISIEHFPSCLRDQFKELTDRETNKIITKAIKEFFRNVQGSKILQQSENEKRFHWRIVK